MSRGYVGSPCGSGAVVYEPTGRRHLSITIRHFFPAFPKSEKLVGCVYRRVPGPTKPSCTSVSVYVSYVTYYTYMTNDKKIPDDFHFISSVTQILPLKG